MRLIVPNKLKNVASNLGLMHYARHFYMEKKFGNILNQSFEKIWYGKELVDFREKFISNPIRITCEKLVINEDANIKEELTQLDASD